MNDLVTDLKKLHEDTLSNLKLSKANNTLRAYKSDFKDFQYFVLNMGLTQFQQNLKLYLCT